MMLPHGEMWKEKKKSLFKNPTLVWAAGAAGVGVQEGGREGTVE